MIYLDSANLDDARIAVEQGWVKGITTNPNLLAQCQLSPKETLTQLALISPGELYYQLTATDFESMIDEGKAAHAIIGEKTVLKVPATQIGFRVVAHLSSQIPCSVTAIYSPAQAIIAHQSGAKYAIAYVNRATRLLGDGLKLVREMANVLAGTGVEILAASLKSPEEAAAARQAGAKYLTLPLDILLAMTTHPLSAQTVTEFNRNGKGLC